MSSKNRPDALAHLFEECRASHNNSRHFSKLAEGFLPTIQKLASKYPSYWSDDFIQEGRLGLLKAVKNFPSSSQSEQFEFYATSIISRQMIDFYRKAIGKSLLERTTNDLEGNSYTWKEPLFVDPPAYSLDADEDEYIFHYPVPGDYVTSVTSVIDVKYCVTKISMKNNFKDKEIKAFDLHFNKEYSVSEVAKKLNISISQASKIISKTRSKAQQILAHATNNNLN
jgi:RNA polymerase sigma factor (sigma-70 family)